MNTREAVDEYVHLTDEIEKLKIKRQILQKYFVLGRNLGTKQDIRFEKGIKKTLSMKLLRTYVSDALISECQTSSEKIVVSIIDRLNTRRL